MTDAPYRIEFSKHARRQLRKLPQAAARRLIRKAEELQAAPRPPGSVKLRGEDDLYRVRVGDWRIIYQIQP